MCKISNWCTRATDLAIRPMMRLHLCCGGNTDVDAIHLTPVEPNEHSIHLARSTSWHALKKLLTIEAVKLQFLDWNQQLVLDLGVLLDKERQWPTV